MSSPENHAARIKARREALGITRADFARKLGVHASTINYQESTPDKYPTPAMLEKIAAALSTSPVSLLFGELDGNTKSLDANTTLLVQNYATLPIYVKAKIFDLVASLAEWGNNVDHVMELMETETGNEPQE